MALLQAIIIPMLVVRYVVGVVVTGREAEDVAVNISGVGVDLVMVALVGRVVDDHLSWTVTAIEICWIEIVPSIANVSEPLTETGNEI